MIFETIALDVPTQVRKMIDYLESLDKSYFGKDRLK
jgi:hypothetical protein